MILFSILSITVFKPSLQTYFKLKPLEIPKEEILFIKENYPGLNFFNDYNSGGFIIFYGDGAFKHFIDGRAGTVYSEEILLDCLYFNTANPNWTKLFELYRIDGAFLPRRLLQRLDIASYFKEWETVHVGNYYVVLVRPEFSKGEANAKNKPKSPASKSIGTAASSAP